MMRIQNRIFGAEISADALLEFLVDRLRAADESDRGHAVAVLIQRLVRRRNNFRVIRQAEVVVGAEIENLGATAVVADLDGRLLRTTDQPFLLVQALRLERFGLGGQ